MRGPARQRRRVVRAAWTVGALAAAGGVLLWLLVGANAPLAHSPASPAWYAPLKPDDNDQARAAKLNAIIPVLAPLHKPLGKPRPGDWLAEHPEPGQTFAQYLDSRPTVPTQARGVLYILPLGPFTPEQERIAVLTRDFMEIFFGLPTRILGRVPLTIIPESARRTHPSWGDRQLHAGYILETLLPPRLPADGAAMICLTASDLYPEESWNFVFGQASTRNRVAVWSLYRFGNPKASEKDFQAALLRMLKISTHETAHMFGLLHCTAYACGMGGANNLSETDSHPLDLCPQCLAKLSWACRTDPVDRYRRLRAFLLAHGFPNEALACRKAIDALLNVPSNHPGTQATSRP